MNNQYMQQPGYYAGPQGGMPPPSYDATPSDVSQNVTKGSAGIPQNYPPRKVDTAPGLPFMANVPSSVQSPYYNNNAPAEYISGLPLPMGNSGNLTDRMSNMSLGHHHQQQQQQQQQRSPSMNFPPPPLSSTLTGSNSNSISGAAPNVNGFNTLPDRPPLDSASNNDVRTSQRPPMNIGGGSQITGQPYQQSTNQQGLPSVQQQSGAGIPVLPVTGNIGQQQMQGHDFPGQKYVVPSMPGSDNMSGPPLQRLPQPGGGISDMPGQRTGDRPPIGPSVNNRQVPLASPGYPPPPPLQSHRQDPHAARQPDLPGQNRSGSIMPGMDNLSGPPPQHLSQLGYGVPDIPGQRMGDRPIGAPINNRQATLASPVYPPQSQQPQQQYPHAFQDPYAGQRAGVTGGPYQGGNAPPGGMPLQQQQHQQQQQARRLDPNQLPSPIQVMQDDERNRGGVFYTNQKGLLPPLVTTKYTTKDQGNSSPRFVRSTMYTVPTCHDTMKQTGVPFGLIVSPMAQIGEGEFEPPIVDMGEIGPVRCIRCKSYMSPFMQFIDAGRRFQCAFCRATSQVPQEYFQHLDHTGQRMDRYERPELTLGTYEYIATTDYCRNNVLPKAPAIIFAIDVSYNNVKSGLVNLICSEMKKIIANLPIDAGQDRTKMKVGFITYDNTVHFYNTSSCLTQPQMMVVGDVQDVFMPLLDGFLCDPDESETVIDSLMAQIPAMFAETRETETVLAPAIQAGLEALKASERPGKLIMFHSSLPIAEAPGKLKNRDDRKVLGTEKEKTVLAPQNNIYNNLGQECVSAGCSVDLFVFNNSFIDIATIGQICRLTGGEVYKYTYFQADTDGERLITDVVNNISRPIAFDAIMRVRTSTGVRATDFYGHFYMSNTTDMELASVDCNKAIAVEIKHDDKLTDDEGVYVQVALLYTSCGGVRRLRIMNLGLRTSSQMSELYRACDLDAIINFFSKQSVFKLIDSSPKGVKDGLIARCATILAAYRKHCASPSSAGQLILPECLKLLPLYVNCLLKSDAMSGGSEMTIDDRSYAMQAVATMPLYTSVIYVYPRLLPLHDIDPDNPELPQQLRCSFEKFTDDGAYLLENGIHMFLWLGLGLSSEWVNQAFGVTLVDTDRTNLPILDTPLNKRVREIVACVRAERHHCMRLTIVRQREKLEMVLRHFLVEDRGNDGSPSYVDFLCHLHREIKTVLRQ